MRKRYVPSDDPRERIAFGKKCAAFYAPEINERAARNEDATITIEMIEAAIACGFDRNRLGTREAPPEE